MRPSTRTWLLLSGALLSVAVGVSAAERAAPAPRLEPKAMEVLKAACERLSTARSLGFTAVTSYESPSRLGPPLVYTTESTVLLARPDKLRVITSGDGPPSEFYDDGTTMMAFAPAENLVAVAEAPATIGAALEQLYAASATYYPFTDLIVADPCAVLTDGLKLAYFIGQSRVVGGTTTDMIALVDDALFLQLWIGAEDRLPRRVRAIYAGDPARLRHQLDLSDWKVDLHVPADVFGSPKAAAATRVEFARPDPPAPPAKSARQGGRAKR